MFSAVIVICRVLWGNQPETQVSCSTKPYKKFFSIVWSTHTRTITIFTGIVSEVVTTRNKIFMVQIPEKISLDFFLLLWICIFFRIPKLTTKHQVTTNVRIIQYFEWMDIAEIFTVSEQDTKHLQAFIVALITVGIESKFRI